MFEHKNTIKNSSACEDQLLDDIYSLIGGIADGSIGTNDAQLADLAFKLNTYLGNVALDNENTMLEYFKHCIDTGTIPEHCIKCYQKILDLIAASTKK